MKWKNSPYTWIISFFTGAIITYIASQYHYFKIKSELDIPQMGLSIITIVVGLYIAHAVQSNLNKSQNKYGYLVMKLDALWSQFSDYEQSLRVGSSVTDKTVRKISKDFFCPLNQLSASFKAFEISSDNITKVEELLDELESEIEACPISGNRVEISEREQEIVSVIDKINKQFCAILILIQDA